MAVGLAGDACFPVGVGALAGPVVLRAVAALVSWGATFVSKMVPALALEATSRFLFDLVHVNPTVTDDEAIGYCPVGGVSVSDR